MDNKKIQPLTEIEKRMAEEYHELVYSFLRGNRYSIEEFYHIVIFGYLKAIQTYNRREDLRKKYQFATICGHYMRAEINNHFKVENAQKRKPTETVINFDATYSEMENFYNCVGGKNVVDELLEVEFLESILENLSEVQRDILKLKLEGYGNKEVYLALEIPSSTFYKEMNRIKIIVENLVG